MFLPVFLSIFINLLFLQKKAKKKNICLALPLNVRDAQLAAHLSVIWPAEWRPWGKALICSLSLSLQYFSLCRHHCTLTTPEQQVTDSEPETLMQGHNRKPCVCHFVRSRAQSAINTNKSVKKKREKNQVRPESLPNILKGGRPRKWDILWGKGKYADAEVRFAPLRTGWSYRSDSTEQQDIWLLRYSSE